MILVYQAYGREDILRQSLFSIISLLSVVSPPSPLKIVIATDNRLFFEKYFAGGPQAALERLEIFDITPEQIRAWRGAINFVHRVKIEVLKAVGQKWPGAVFYVDGDTFFREDPTTLFQKVDDGHSLMHIAENVLKEGRDPLTKKIAKFTRKNKFQVQGEVAPLSPDTVMWNAGALGISQNNKYLLDFVLGLTDQMHAAYPKHVMEQLAFSCYLQSKTKVISGEKEIGHYWQQKEEYQAAIDQFLKLNPSLAQGLKAYPQFVHPKPLVPVVTKKYFWQNWLS